MHNQKKAYLYAFAAIACWSTIGSAFKISLQYLDPANLLFYSGLTASGLLYITIRVRKISTGVMQMHKSELSRTALSGLLNPFLYYLVLLKAYDLLPAQEAGTLNYIWPLVLVLLSIPVLKQRINGWSILAVFISFAGIILISWRPDLSMGSDLTTCKEMLNSRGDRVLGVVLAVGSAFFWSGYWLLNLRDHREPIVKVFLSLLAGTIYTGIYLSLTGGFAKITWPGLAGAVYIGIFEMGLTFVLWLNALRYSTTTAKVSNLIYLSPFVSLFIIHYAVGETIRAATVAGLCLIVGGIILQYYTRNRVSR